MINSITDIEKYLKTKDITVDIAQSPNPLQQVWQLHWYSNAGEDIWETIYHSNTIESIVKAISGLADNFDAEEHTKLYVNSAGENGVPSLKELIEDAYDIKEFLMNIASELTNITKTNNNQKDSNESKFQIIGIQFPGENGIDKTSLIDLIDHCSGCYIDTLRIDGENSSAIFVFDSDVYDDWLGFRLEAFIDYIRDILDDVNKESPNSLYEFGGIKFKLSY